MPPEHFTDSTMNDYLIEFECAPGDIVVATAAVRDVLDTYPDIRLGFRSNHPALTSAIRRLTPVVQLEDPTVVLFDYSPGLHLLRDGQYHEHFLTWFHRQWSRETGLPVKCLQPKGHVLCSEPPLIEGDYWLLLAGGKEDMTTKHWSFIRYEQTARCLRSAGINLVQTGSSRDIHPRVSTDLDMVGVGGLHEFINQVAYCQGVICPITCAMHLAAVFDKPCVVIAGGREHVCWEAYTNEGQFGQACSPVKVPHKFLHTIGRLDCCATGGCWRKKAEPPAAADQLCSRPSRELFQILPECMKMVSVEQVVEAVLSYGTPSGTKPRRTDRGRHDSRRQTSV